MDRPAYDHYTDMSVVRGPLGEAFARQALLTAGPWLPKPPTELDVLDVGSGYGHTALALAASCRSVVGLEPAGDLYAVAEQMAEGVKGLSFRHGGVETLDDREAFDLIVLDNVYEHLPDQPGALANMHRALRPGGVLYLLTPNKTWPIEAHYRLPFLSWLPLPVANVYLRVTRRGTDYTDASYAPAARQLGRAMTTAGFDWRFVLPGDPSATVAGAPIHYRAGMWALRRLPALWAISKSLLVVATRP